MEEIRKDFNVPYYIVEEIVEYIELPNQVSFIIEKYNRE